MVVVWCPDWPVVAWGIPLDEPVAVVSANRVVATSPAARSEGVEVGQRRRQAQGRCPDVVVLERDVDREARLFEPVSAALEAITPAVEVTGAGLVGFPTKGPAYFFGGDAPLANQVLEVVTPVLAGRGEARVGIADGVFAARLAAQTRSARLGPVIIEPGGTAAFLDGIGVGALPMPDLVEVLVRLGLVTLGDFSRLDAGDVSGRFGADGLVAHRLARGADQYPPDLRRPAHDLAVTWVFEPPAERIDQCAFAAKALADQLHASLAADGLACVRVAIEAETEGGETQLRLWRHEGALSAAALADRARWQLDGWLHTVNRPSSGVARLTLIPDEVVPAVGRQLGFWGGRAHRADDVTRVVARIQALLGPETVSVPERKGGRQVSEQITLVPAAAVDLGEERPAAERGWVTEPWPGRIPDPAPSCVLDDPAPIGVHGVSGASLAVTGRGELSAPPASVTIDRRRLGVVGWAGPWPAEVRWWDPAEHRRVARMQVLLEDGGAHLIMIEDSQWWLEATY